MQGPGLVRGPGAAVCSGPELITQGQRAREAGVGAETAQRARMTVDPGKAVGKGPRNNSRTDKRMARWMEGCSSAERKQTLDRALEMDVEVEREP